MEALKDYLRNTTVNIKTQTEDKQKKHPEGWSKKKHRSERQSHYNKSVTLYFTFMNIVLEI